MPVIGLQASPPAAPPTFQPTLDELLHPQPHMIMPSQQALRKFLEDCCGSIAESLMSLFPHPNTFTTNPDNLIRREVENPAPSLLHPIQDIDEAPPPATSDGSFQFPLFPKAKKRATSTSCKVSPRLKVMSPKHLALHLSPAPASKKLALDKRQTLACFFCRGRKIACGPPLLGSPDQTCK